MLPGAGGMVMDGAVTMMVIGAVLMMVRDFITSAIQTVLGYVFVSVEVSDQDSSEVRHVMPSR